MWFWSYDCIVLREYEIIIRKSERERDYSCFWDWILNVIVNIYGELLCVSFWGLKRCLLDDYI